MTVWDRMIEFRKIVLRVLLTAGLTTGSVSYGQNQVISLQEKVFDGTFRHFPIAQPIPTYSSMDEAATYFVNYVRKHFKTQFVEYCATIKEISSEEFSFTEIYIGSPGGCRLSLQDDNIKAMVHTHPLDELNNLNLSWVFQVFSANDIEAAEFGSKYVMYLGAPAGHILRYMPGTSICRPYSVQNPYVMVRKPSAKSKNQLMISSHQFVTFDVNEKPSYCP